MDVEIILVKFGFKAKQGLILGRHLANQRHRYTQT